MRDRIAAVLAVAAIVALLNIVEAVAPVCPTVELQYPDEYMTVCEDGRTLVIDYVEGEVVDVVEE